MSGRTHVPVTPEVRAVLDCSEVTATSVKLPPGQLPRPLYVAVNRVLEAAGGKWNRSAGAHLFERDPRAVLGLALAEGAIADEKKLYQVFETPPAVADRLVELAQLPAGAKVLEPSAGSGRLVDAVLRRRPDAQVFMFEIRPEAARALADRLGSPFPHAVMAGDFLALTEQPTANPQEMDAVVMNPPFTRYQDARHMVRAWRFVRPGGRLVGICTPNIGVRQVSFYRQAKAIHDAHCVHQELLPDGTFHAEGTEVRAQIVVWQKP